jgi:hypothetical protein
MGLEARAGIIVFDTESTATQNISSGLGDFSLTSTGTQQFTIDTTHMTANVTSSFQGSDFPDPGGGSDKYNLYNTATTGTVTMNGDGSYNIAFHLLFELDVTSGNLNGLSLVTTTDATFATTGATLPFLPGTAFADPNLPSSDAVDIYLKSDLSSPVGVSFDRLVTINSVVPEPSAITLLGIGLAGLCGYMRRTR